MKTYLDFINENKSITFNDACAMINCYIPDGEVYQALDVLLNFDKEFQNNFSCTVAEYREVVDWIATHIKNIKIKKGPKSNEILLNGIHNSTIPKYIHIYSEFDICKQLTINNCNGLIVDGSFSGISTLEKITINDSNVLLTELKLENQKLREFHSRNSTIKFPSIMYGYINLQTIICNNCELLDIENICTNLKRVTSMYLINCGLSEIPKFQNMTSLLLLDLSKNKISKIDNIEGVERINKLICKDNIIDTISDNITFFIKLKTLVLSGNLLQELPDSINKLKLLRNINLDNNKFKKAPENINKKPVNPLVISLNGNNI